MAINAGTHRLILEMSAYGLVVVGLESMRYVVRRSGERWPV
jgi:hypothetical protein